MKTETPEQIYARRDLKLAQLRAANPQMEALRAQFDRAKASPDLRLPFKDPRCCQAQRALSSLYAQLQPHWECQLAIVRNAVADAMSCDSASHSLQSP